MICAFARFVVGSVFLRQYDEYYLFAKCTGWAYGQLILALSVAGIGGLICSFTAEVPATVRSIAFLAKDHPVPFVLLDSILFAGGIWFSVESLLMTLWVLFRRRKAEKLPRTH
jgi:hypothetical protein